MKPFFRRSEARSRRCLSSLACTLEDSTSARVSLASMRASSAPFFTRWPSSKPMRSMRPAISGRITIDSSARRLPTAPASSTARASLAGTALTGSAAPGFWAQAGTAARHNRTTARRTSRFYLLMAVPLPQLDRVAIGIPNLGARVVGALHRTPGGLDALRLQHLQGKVHVLDLEREALPAEPRLHSARRDRGLGIVHHFERGVAELEVNEIERPGRSARNAHALALAEAEHPGV